MTRRHWVVVLAAAALTSCSGSPARDGGVGGGQAGGLAGGPGGGSAGGFAGGAAGGGAAGGTADAGVADASVADGGVNDAGAADGGPIDGGLSDGGASDGGLSDGGASDGGLSDGGSTDGGTASDAGPSDAGTARLGDPCTQDSDCYGLLMPPGLSPWCKIEQYPSGLRYADGYCTRRCSSQTDCGPGNTCVYWQGPWGEVDNICTLGCDGGCRGGYSCRDVGLVPGDYAPVCFPLQSDGGLPQPFDAGPGAASVAGTSCTLGNMVTTCGAAPYFHCEPELLADGGRTGFPNGMCTGDCSTTLDDSWCGTSRGSCNPYLTDADAYGEVLRWLCDRTCTGTNPSCGRSQYVCEDYNGVPVCRPDCRIDAGPGCSAPYVCNMSNGLCE